MTADSIQSIALQRIRKLFDAAESISEKQPERAKQYVRLARKISSRNKSRIPKELQSKYCKSCNAYWKQSKPEKKTPFLVYTCPDCGKQRRIPITPKTSQSRV